MVVNELYVGIDKIIAEKEDLDKKLQGLEKN